MRAIAHAGALAQMEGPLHDLQCACILLQVIYEDAMVPVTHLSVGEGFTAVVLTDDQQSALSYALFLVRSQIDNLVEQRKAFEGASP